MQLVYLLLPINVGMLVLVCESAHRRAYLARSSGIALRVLLSVVNRSYASTGGKSLSPQLGRGSESLNQGLVHLSHETRIQELVDGVLLAGLLEKLQVVVNVSHGVGSNGTGGSGTRSSDAGEAGISAPKQTIHGGLQVGEGEGQNAAQNASLWRRRSSSPGHAVRSTISSKEGLVGKRRTDDGEFKSVANVGDGPLNGLKKDLHALLLVLFVLLGSRRKLLPRLVGFASRRVHVNDVLSFGANGLVEQGGDEERAKILRVLHRSIPILHDEMGGVLEMGQIQTSGINAEEKMRNGTVTGQGAEIVPPLGQFLGLILLLRHQLDRIERCGIGNNGLASLDDIAILKSNANGATILNEDLINASIELELATELLQTTLKSLAELGGTTNWNRKGCRLLEEALENVKDMCRHGALGGETTEDAHAIDEVANKRHGDNFINRLGQIVEGQGQVGEDVGVLSNEGESTSRRGEETSVLAEIQKCNSRCGSTESLETITKGIPLLRTTFVRRATDE